MQEHADNIARFITTITYGISGGLVVGDWIAIIDQHTWIIGAALGFLTYATNLVFRILGYYAIKGKA